MRADPTAQQALLQIADLDSKAAQLRHRRATLPENEKLAALAKQRATLSEQVVAIDTRLADVAAEQERIEADLTPARARLQRNQKTIDAGAADPKALQAMIAETTHLAGRISTLEDAELDVMQSIEDETANHERVVAQRTGIENQMRELLASRDTTGKELDLRLAHLAEQRAQLAGRLPAPLVELYDKVAQRTGGTGAAELRAKRCTGCGIELDMTELKHQASAAPDEVLRCEECGRILVRTGESGL